MGWIIRQLRRLTGCGKHSGPEVGESLASWKYVGPVWSASEHSSHLAVPNAFYYVLNRQGGVDRRAAAALVSRLMLKVRPSDWTRLYREFSGIGIRPGQVAVLARYPVGIAVELLGVATLNHDGFVRQAALDRLARVDHPRAMPYVILRLADWVLEVRLAARNALSMLLAAGHGIAMLDCGYLMDWLEKVERVDLTSLRGNLLEELRNTSHRQAVDHRMRSADVRGRLFCFRLLEDEIPGNGALIEAALSDPSPSVRRWVVPHIFSATQSAADRWIGRLLADKCVIVRVNALRRLDRTRWPHFQARIEDLLFDSSPTVREVARFLMKRHGIADFAERCRQRIDANPQPQVGPIAGLGETGDARDADRVTAFAASPRPRIRAAAIAALGRLARKKAIPPAVHALDDPSGKVRRASIGLLQADLTNEIIERVSPMLLSASEAGRLAALKVIGHRKGWDMLPHALSAVTQSSERVSDLAWTLLVAWSSTCATQGWIGPSPGLRAEVARKFEQLQASGISPPPHAKRAWRILGMLLAAE